MFNNLSSPLLTLLTFGLSVFLAGGFLGGEWSRRSQTKTEIKELEQKQKELLTHIKTAFEQARKRDSITLQQVDSVYAILYTLDIQEGRLRGEKGKLKTKIDEDRKKNDEIRRKLAEQSAKSDFDFAK